jgi:hypothetical protein
LQTSIYRRQHDELGRLVGALAAILETGTPADLRTALARLAGVLKVHLAMEDKNMYPRLLEHADPGVRSLATEYRRTMSDLAPAFTSYYDRWSETAIERDRRGFAEATKGIAAALAARISLENDNLYAMVDRESIAVD